jgi:plasmid stability protein
MPYPLVRNVEAELVERLKRRAHARGRSIEAEHREILREALTPAQTGCDLLALIRSGSGFDLNSGSVRSGETGRPADFGDG